MGWEGQPYYSIRNWSLNTMECLMLLSVNYFDCFHALKGDIFMIKLFVLFHIVSCSEWWHICMIKSFLLFHIVSCSDRLGWWTRAHSLSYRNYEYQKSCHNCININLNTRNHATIVISTTNLYSIFNDKKDHNIVLWRRKE